MRIPQTARKKPRGLSEPLWRSEQVRLAALPWVPLVVAGLAAIEICCGRILKDVHTEGQKVTEGDSRSLSSYGTPSLEK